MTGNGYGTGMGMGGAWAFGLLLIAGTVLLTVVVVRAINGGVRGGAGPAHTDDGRSSTSHAREVLDERYARGELATEEYRERLTTLREGG